MRLYVILLLVFCLPASANNIFKTLILEKQSTPSPTVIVAHGCDGTKNLSYINWMKMLSSWGYNSVMVDSFSIRDYPTGVCHSPRKVTPEVRSQDIKELADFVKQQEWHKGKIAVIGFSHGGSTVMNIANNSNINNIDIAVAYYPSCYDKIWFGKRYDFIGIPYSNPLIPVQIHFAEDDSWTPPKECKDINKYEHFFYKNATHAFDMPFPDRTAYGHYMSYNKEADQISKERTKVFLKKYLTEFDRP